jgi:NAD(P)-dependent dehydrogenase (short-subunit alcohol dehydrogenase family)
MLEQPVPLRTLFDLSGQVCIVTGGAKGIGRAVSRRLAEAGAQIMVLDVDAEGAEQAARDLETLGATAAFIHGDVSEPAHAVRAVEAAEALWGRVDLLINNAGIYPFAPALECDDALWSRVMDVNLKGTFFLTRAVAARLIQIGRKGAIVNIASINAYAPISGLAAYSAAKAGIVMLTRSLAQEFGRFGIRVNAIAPGGIETPGGAEANRTIAQAFGIAGEQVTAMYLNRVPLGRMGHSDDVALAALFLASPAASYITGASLVVDGGYLLS